VLLLLANVYDCLISIAQALTWDIEFCPVRAAAMSPLFEVSPRFPVRDWKSAAGKD